MTALENDSSQPPSGQEIRTISANNGSFIDRPASPEKTEPAAHQTVFGPEQPRVPQGIEYTASETEPTVDTAATAPKSDQNTPETDSNTSVSEMERLYAEIENLYRSLEDADHVTISQIKITLSKLDSAIKSSQPIEAGLTPIKKTFAELQTAVEQNPYFTANSGSESTPVSSYLEPLKELLAQLKNSTDPSERKTLSDQAEKMFQTQVDAIGNLIAKRQQSAPDIEKLKSAIENAKRQADEKERQIVNLVNDGQPLPPDCIAYKFARLMQELSQISQKGLTLSPESSQKSAKALEDFKALLQKTHQSSPDQNPPETDTSQTPETPPAATLTPEQKSFLDLAATDKTSWDRLGPLIKVFGTPEVQSYYAQKTSQTASEQPASNPSPTPNQVS